MREGTCKCMLARYKFCVTTFYRPPFLFNCALCECCVHCCTARPCVYSWIPDEQTPCWLYQVNLAQLAHPNKILFVTTPLLFKNHHGDLRKEAQAVGCCNAGYVPCRAVTASLTWSASFYSQATRCYANVAVPYEAIAAATIPFTTKHQQTIWNDSLHGCRRCGGRSCVATTAY